MSAARWPMWVQVVVGVIFVAGIVLGRLADHIPNVAPVGAVALLAGSYFSWPWAAVVPLGAMLVSDAFIGFASLPIVLSVYGSFLLAGFVGRIWLHHRTPGRVVAGSLLGSTLFYLITNAAVWRFSSLYPPTLGGLLQSYTMGLPFFRMTLLGDLFYTGALFLVISGCWATVRHPAVRAAFADASRFGFVRFFARVRGQ